MFFPKGEWYNFWNNELVRGGEERWVDADIDSMPIFVKAGAIIPKYPIQQYVGEKIIEELKLEVYYKKGKDESHVFEDAQDGYDYKKGRYSLRSFNSVGKKNSLTIQQFKTGKFITSYDTFEIHIHGLPFKIDRVEVDNEEIDISKINGDVTLTVSKEFTELHIIGKK